MRDRRKKTLIDLFAGCGGLSLGMEQAGFTPVFANEIWEPAAETYRNNRRMAKNKIFVGDIQYLVDHLSDFPIPKEVTLASKLLNNYNSHTHLRLQEEVPALFSDAAIHKTES